MRGIILSFTLRDSAGLISGEDGQRYRFSAAEWMAEGFPIAGANVDFVGSASTAREIFALNAPALSQTKPALHADDGMYKSSDDKMVMGVCAGLAHKLNISRAGLRIVTFLLAIFFVFPILIYIAMGLVLRARPTS
jgi:phage shock protein PspC (stress-responsive transcriptional regulator)